MREMVLNHASLQATDRDAATRWIKDMVVGMAELARGKYVQKSIRALRPLQEILLGPDHSLDRAMQDLRIAGARDEYVFFMGLATKIPLLVELEPNEVGRFRACQARELPPEDGAPLLLVVLFDWVAVGFPSAEEWDRDQLVVSFDELLPDASIEETSETIDNLTRSRHAAAIGARHGDRLRSEITPGSFWRQRKVAFPHLTFGLDVEEHIANLPLSLFQTVVNKLAKLDASVARWRVQGGAAPRWTCQVTPESESVMNNAKLRAARRFRTHGGERKIFEWHARYGSGGRIHLRFESSTRQVEIGYIGSHLPL